MDRLVVTMAQTPGNRAIKRLGKAAACLATVLAIDCAPLNSNVAITPANRLRNERRAIEVVTRDGRLIHYRSNSYRVVENADSIFIEGKGRLKRDQGLFVDRPFNETIPQSRIEQVSLVKKWDPDHFGGVMLLIILTIPFAFTSLTS